MIRIDLAAARELYAADSARRRLKLAAAFGPLRATFERFLATESRLRAYAEADLERLFSQCTDPRSSERTVAAALRALSPGAGGVGFRQVNRLVDLLRTRIGARARERVGPSGFASHIHAFGSGGDFVKTGHATTSAAIAAAPLVPILKTGTTNVTARHGSAEAAAELGFRGGALSASEINGDLARFGFAFVPLAALGFGYGATLSRCRLALWREASERVSAAARARSRVRALAETEIPLDIFKIVSPNAQLLDPRWHVTGVCHRSMFPYVLGIFLYLGTRGMILHSLDGIDELANGHSLGGDAPPNNLVVEVTARHVLISEFRPEDVGVASCDLSAIEEEPAAANDARTLIHVLSGRDRGPRRDFIALNAAALLCESRDEDQALTDLLRERKKSIGALLGSGESYANLRGLLATLSVRQGDRGRLLEPDAQRRAGPPDRAASTASAVHAQRARLIGSKNMPPILRPICQRTWAWTGPMPGMSSDT